MTERPQGCGVSVVDVELLSPSSKTGQPVSAAGWFEVGTARPRGLGTPVLQSQNFPARMRCCDKRDRTGWPKGGWKRANSPKSLFRTLVAPPLASFGVTCNTGTVTPTGSESSSASDSPLSSRRRSPAPGVAPRPPLSHPQAPREPLPLGPLPQKRIPWQSSLATVAAGSAGLPHPES